jgi:hypothetical protein
MEMLFACESQIQEIAGRFVINPSCAGAIAAFALRVRRTEMHLAREGISIDDAIKEALRRP